MKRGDLIGFRTSGVFACLIRFGQALAHVRHRDITHIAVVADDLANPEIIQSVRRVNNVLLSSYGKTPHVVIPFVGTDDQRREVVDFL